MPTLELRPKGLRRLERGHPWLFASDLRARADTPEEPAVVDVLGARGERLGQGFYNPRSKLALRLVTSGLEAVGPDLLEARLRAAIRYRERVAEGFEAYRVVHADADGLPGFTVDKYADVLVYQLHAAALEPFLAGLLELLTAHYRPRGVLARNDSGLRALEGLPRQLEVVRGEVPEVVPYEEAGVTLFARPFDGQKTGAFLDQRENHVYAGTLAAGRALDVFAYGGGFALQLAGRAESVLAVDSSEGALEGVKQAAAYNGLSNVATRQGDAFETLRALYGAGERFDTVVLDPPAFAKSRQHLAGALRGYKDINLQAMRLLKPGGRLVSASCSQALSDEAFCAMLQDAAADAGRSFRVLARRGQAACHPELLALPETHYLKLVALEAV